MKKIFPKNHSSGFTLIEIITVIFILTIIGVSIANFQSDVFSFNRTLTDNLTTQDEITRAFKVMSTEIRSMSFSNKGAYPLIEALPASLIFYNDINADGRKEKIRYFVEGTTLKRGVTESAGNSHIYNPQNEVISDLIHNVVNEGGNIFTYYDSDYDGFSLGQTEALNTNDIRLVKIDILIDTDTSQSPETTSFTTQISIRILKDNP
jgi:prepilin-type N-terminal cleavage/methylation domain-containing protein